MGTTPAETLNEIAAARERLEGDLAVLQARLPARDELLDRVRTYGIYAGAGTATLGLAGLVWTRRRDRKRREKDARALLAVMDRS